MPDDTHFRKLERMYRRAAINRLLPAEMTISAGAAEITLVVREDQFHAAGAVHGAVYFKLLDEAGFFAANSLVEDVFVLTVTFNLYLLQPIADGTIHAAGRVVHAAGSSFLAESVATNAAGEIIARGSGTFVRSRIALSPAIGYE